MQRHQTVALRERGRLAALVSTVVHQARRQEGWREPDRRTLRTWRQFVLGLVVARSTRLVAVGQAVLGQRAARSVKAVAMALGSFLSVGRFPAPTVSTQVLEAAVRQLDPTQVATYRGKVVLALDPTDYPKRSRGRSKTGRHMEHVGRVRKPVTGGKAKRRRRPPRRRPLGAAPAVAGAPRTAVAPGAPPATTVATTSGYVDVWTGLVLTGKQLLPLARALFSNRHPALLSQNKIEEAVLDAAWALLERLGWAAILVADRAFGRKELLVALVTRWVQRRDFVIRVDADFTVFPAASPADSAGALLGDVLAAQPVLGEVVWDRGQEGKLRCEARTVTATIRFSRSGRQHDYTAATLQFVELSPLDGVTDPLVLATTLPVDTLAAVKGVVRVYSWRWSIETAFETMKAWGLGRFMVRRWQAIDRLLWLVAVAYALLVVAARDGPLAILREQAERLLKRVAVLGRRLTVGKLAQAIGLDYQRHRRAWSTVWLA
jgi:Transposase DDE domain